jgi:hypothetical protein
MDPTTTWIVLILVLVVAAGAAVLYLRQRRTKQLRARFGPEYDRSVQEVGNPRRAEAELAKREERVAHLDIRPLSAEERGRFPEAWRSIQALFVDDPGRAIAEADRLVTEVMRVRGYPVTDFEQRAADISVDHPRVVENYRAAIAIARRNDRGEASTEDLRQAMVHDRALFEDLLETEPAREKELNDDRATYRVA